MNMSLIFTFMLITSTILMILSTTMLIKNVAVILEWKILEMSSNSMSFMMMMDWKSSFFMFSVATISSAIITYNKFYMPKDQVTKFTKTILTFVLSMMILIASPNLVSVMLGWEGLGMSSFILIMFFMNKKSMMSSIYTMIMNRMGDIMMMIAMMLAMNMNTWSILSMTTESSKMLMMALCVGMFSKSAQIPFSSWLTEAMAAPTPVSALVHSSTLVTAGVYLMIRLELSMKLTNINKFVLITATMTLVMASMNALTEWDIKKLVALSTLSQLSVMFISISISMYKMAMFHMLMHAMFKALLFLCSSTMISMANSQDIRKISNSNQPSIVTMMSFNTANLTLMGLIFTSGFYSKELIIEMMEINKMNYFTMMMFLTCMAITMYYSIKMMVFTSNKTSKTKMKNYKENKNQKMSKILILMPSVIAGNKMNWIVNMNAQIPYLIKMEKTAPIAAMLLTIAVIKEMNSKNLAKNKKLKMFMNFMWFMKNFSIKTKMSAFPKMMMLNKHTETGILEYTMNNTKKNMEMMTNFKIKIHQQNIKKMMMNMLLVILVMI
uniref:NADH:ubiquinone reductase (H(+)-translocating) n=1 Tax=Tetraleurodes acaciae TaxID=267835 RepID=Q674P6_TETAA|nr:NADH dehydrogenase subunit 5 [Tetraleurodes acaciae]AAU14153.1 NADH dehydrogenase subunit 5 [Tetraleurodes acaciae]